MSAEKLLHDCVEEIWPQFPPLPEGYFPATISLIQVGKKSLLGCLTYVNYFRLGKHGQRINVTADGPNRISRNMLLLYNKQFSITGQCLIDDFVARPFYSRSQKKGLSNVRLFIWKEQLYFLANIAYSQERLEYWQCLGTLGNFRDIISILQNSQQKTVKPLRIIFLRKFADVFPGNQKEKHWLPVIREEKLWLIHKLSDGLWIRANQRGEIREFKKLQAPLWENLQGTAGPIKISGRILMIARQVTKKSSRRTCKHCLVELDEEGKFLRNSPFFVFAQHGLEFCHDIIPWSSHGVLLIVSINYNDLRGYYIEQPLNLFLGK